MYLHYTVHFKAFAPPGTLATLTGLTGGAHYGFGKGIGGLVGGVLKDQLQSTALAFRLEINMLFCLHP